jgi:hypothetical protein
VSFYFDGHVRWQCRAQNENSINAITAVCPWLAAGWPLATDALSSVPRTRTNTHQMNPIISIHLLYRRKYALQMLYSSV